MRQLFSSVFSLVSGMVFGSLVWQVAKPSVSAISAPLNVMAKVKASFERPERIPYPETNPYTQEKYHLGKTLFFDPRLSRSNMIACASCHNPGLSWTDGLPKGVGHGHKQLGRRVPAIINVAWGWSFFWDGRAKSLEEQALGPIQSEAEMNMPIPLLIRKLEAMPGYRTLFSVAFPEESISGETIAKAIATFERTVVSDIAPFDKWIGGEESAISEEAKRGFALFNGKAACVRCHSGWNFTNGSFADIGLKGSDLGQGKLNGEKDLNYTFKTPSLRNVTRRGPYMHDGSLAALEAVLENYSRGGTVQRPSTKLFLKPLALSQQERKDLISFLETLESNDEAVSVPSLPRGGEQEGSWRSLSSTH